MKSAQVQNVYVVARNVGALSAFYQKALGFRLAFADAQRWHQFKLLGSAFSVSSEAEAAVSAGQGFVPVFEIADGDSAAAAVVSAGGTFVGQRDMGAHGKAITLRDIEGNAFQLFERGS